MGALLGGVMLLAAAVMVSIEVILRKLFVVSVGGANELSTYALAIGSCWAFGYALMERAHIRIDTVYRMFSHRVCVLIDLVSVLSIVAFVTLLAWRTYGVVEKSLELGSRANTPMGTPMWIPQGLYFVGLVVFALIAAFVFVRASRAFARGELMSVTRQIGTPGVEEEVTKRSTVMTAERDGES